jgi:uncharacterized protein YjbI with pentapeptide repeats
MDFIGGPLLRYIFLSLFALLLLTACGGNDLDQLEQSGFNECVGCDLSGADLTGANLADVIGADFTGALNVSANYLKD